MNYYVYINTIYIYKHTYFKNGRIFLILEEK